MVTNNDSRGVDFRFDPGQLTLSSSVADVGQSQVEMPIVYDGPAVTLTLDYRYVCDFLKVLNPESSIELEIENSDTAAVFSADDGRYGYVVMPLSRDR